MRQSFQIKAQCTIFRDNLQLNSKKKSKLSVLSLDEKGMVLVIEGKGQNQQFRFPIQKLKIIHRKFIDQGRITIQFDWQGDSKIYKGIQKGNQNIQAEGNFQIFIANSCKQNLQYLINQLVALRKKVVEPQKKQASKQKLLPKEIPQKRQKKISQCLKTEQNQQIRPKIGRKYLLQIAKEPKETQIKNNCSATQQIVQVKDLFKTIPLQVLREIFSFTGYSLSNRLVSKQVNELVLKNLTYLRLKDDIQQQIFNKLAKWAITIRARPKNVKNLKLEDKFDDQVLVKQKAKSLYFGNWKQISSKNIQQLKGLRIYCLQIPYAIKWELIHLNGLRLVQLRLKGKGVTTKNNMIRDEDLLYFINNVRDLKVLQVAYASTKLITQIARPEKMQQISIGTLNTSTGTDDWLNFQKFQNLKILQIESLQKNSAVQNSSPLSARFPLLTNLSLGFPLSIESIQALPISIKNLKLLGSFFYNEDFKNFFLPELKFLQIIECPNLTPECLSYLGGGISVRTNWNRNNVDNAMEYYGSNGISVQSVRGFTYC